MLSVGLMKLLRVRPGIKGSSRAHETQKLVPTAMAQEKLSAADSFVSDPTSGRTCAVPWPTGACGGGASLRARRRGKARVP